MEVIKAVLVLGIGLLHLYFFYLEAFLWTKPKGLAVFGMSPEQAKSSETLASNQGVYNALLAVGLFVGLFLPELYRLTLWTYILSFIVVAGIYGGLTVSKRIVFIQSIPAAVTLAIILIW